MSDSETNGAVIRVDGTRVEIRTRRLRAKFDGTVLYALEDARGKRLLERDPASGAPGLELAFSNGDVQALGTTKHARVQIEPLGASTVQIHVRDVEGDGCLRIHVSPAGQLQIEPSAQTIRRGLMGVRWNIGGMPRDAKAVIPTFQGCRQDFEHPLIAGGSRSWPMSWEAAIVIVEVAGSSWSVSGRDTASRPKRLHIGHKTDARSLGIQTETHGPWDMATAVGSQVWVLDVFDGDWQGPAAAYRDWLREAFDYEGLKRQRAAWVQDIRLTMQWQPCSAAVLDALAARIPPRAVLLHVPDWRSDGYDRNYPEYNASAAGKEFIRYAVERGFRVLPHFNYWGIDPSHPEYSRMAEYVLREAGTRRVLGWRWSGDFEVFPQGHGLLKQLGNEWTIAYIHPGSSAWRRLFAQRFSNAMLEVGAHGGLIDQTFCSWNAENSLVENLSVVEGAVTLAKELSELDTGFALAGEGLNEMTAQYQAFSQVHLFNSPFANHELLPELDPVPLGHFLYGELCRSVGYNGLNDKTEGAALRMDVHQKLGALPTLTRIGEADEITAPGAAVRHAFDQLGM